tara:strand:- start:271 stop:531 length:261 start_codon:yes stop_codon:yes gene_type:complete
MIEGQKGQTSTISNTLDVMRMTYESLLYADEVSQETYNLITGASMLFNVLTEDYGPEWFTVEEERFIVEFAELINEKIKEMYSNEV